MEASFWNSEFKSQNCDYVEEPANVLQVPFARSIKTELTVCVRLSREHKMCDTISVFLDSQFIWGEKNSPAKKL